MGELYVEKSTEPIDPNYRWYRELTRYHWFVFLVAALGWVFDCLDQQLFNLARVPAMQELLSPGPGLVAPKHEVDLWSPLSTSVFLIGWATGGILFGIMGDKVGRAKTMLWTILIYSIFTGLSAFSRTVWDFSVYRFLTGLGVGGEFAVGVALLAEVMPNRARPYALGLLQGLSTVGNVTAALIGLGLAGMTDTLREITWFGFHLSVWRVMFMIGTLPALLAIVIRARLKEPERWQSAVATGKKQTAGSLKELFGDPVWRKRAFVGMILASSGVIGLWGIAYFSFDLNRSVFLKTFNAENRELGEASKDQEFLRLALSDPELFKTVNGKLQSSQLLSPTAAHNDAQVLYATAEALAKENKPLSPESVLAALDVEAKPRPAQSPEDRQRRLAYLQEAPVPKDDLAQQKEWLKTNVQRITDREKTVVTRLNTWVAYTSMMFNVGAFLGIWTFTRMAQRHGRKPTFAVAFLGAMLSTIGVFYFTERPTDVFWMTPVMGFCQLSIFGGYAIYFPELFPTRLRSTGTSFCYNVGRFLAAAGPATLGILSSQVFQHTAEPIRWSGITMCSIFLLGLAVLPFAPETKGQPLLD